MIKKPKLIQMQPNEVWKDIQGYEGLYQISNLGRVKSLPRGNKKERIRVPRASNNGYLYMVLSKENKAHTIRIHKEVAKAFIPNPLNLKSVNHKNLDKTDNRLCNLEWMSMMDNVHHARENGRNSRKPVLQCDLGGNVIREWKSAYHVEKELGYFGTLISRCCRGKKKTYKGYKWRFVYE